MATLNQVSSSVQPTFRFQLARATETNMRYALNPAKIGELIWESTNGVLNYITATDTSSAAATYKPITSLDFAVTYDDEVVCNDGEVVYNI